MAAEATLVFDTATAFWRSAAMFAACDLGVFDGLAEGAATAPELAGRLGASERGVQALLDSCASLGLVEKDGPVYRNTETAGRHLTSAAPESLLAALKLQAATFPMWNGLAKAVREGKPVLPPSHMLGEDPELTRHLTLGMHQRALGLARCLAECVDLGDRSLVADVGGGPGTLSVALARKHPRLRARVMDLAPVLEIAKELIGESGVGERIATVPCDVTRDDLGSGFDAALVSGLLHRMSPRQCRSILRKVFEGLDDGGTIVVVDLFETGGGPEMAVLFGLQMLLTTDHGQTHAAADVSRWLGDAGFVKVRAEPLPPPQPHTLLIGEKP